MRARGEGEGGLAWVEDSVVAEGEWVAVEGVEGVARGVGRGGKKA